MIDWFLHVMNYYSYSPLTQLLTIIGFGFLGLVLYSYLIVKIREGDRVEIFDFYVAPLFSGLFILVSCFLINFCRIYIL